MARRRRSGTYAAATVVVLVAGALAYKYWSEVGATGGRGDDISLVGQVDGQKSPALRKVSGGDEASVGSKTVGSRSGDSKTGDSKSGDSPAEASTKADGERVEPDSGVPEKPAAALSADRVGALTEAAEAAVRAEDWVEARGKYNQAFVGTRDAEQRRKLGAKLQELADQTLFSKRQLPTDPLVTACSIEPGQSLRGIAAQYKVTDNLLARINELASKNLIQAGQRLKVVHGPFHAVVYKGRFEMEVYLADVLVRRYPVGLGEDDGTPTGVWRVKNKLVNPTYYPPRGGKQVLADDPTNPLGERWIGLEGVSGEAAGQEKYGIHGTIEPESIGKNMSLGCVRLHNKDVEELYDLLVEKDSLVTVKP